MTNNLDKNSWLKNYVVEQKCIPWFLISLWKNSKMRILYARLRANLINTNTNKYWDKLWSTETLACSERRLYPNMYSKIASLISVNSLVLDVGCGMGILMDKLIVEKKCRVIGIDISEEAIRFIMNKGMIGIVGKVPPLSFPSECFDFVIATEFLEHLRDPERALREFFRVLKTGGMYIVSVPEESGPEINKEHLRSYNKEEFRIILTSIFKEIHIVTVKENFESHNLIIGYGKK